jgi:hypothetical protein
MAKPSSSTTSVFDLLRYRQHVAPLCSAHSIFKDLRKQPDRRT